MNKIIITLLCCLIVASCDDDSTVETVNLRINHFKQTAVGEGYYLVLLVQEDEKIGSDEWTFLYTYINGFNFEWGYVYDIVADKKKINNPPADGSSFSYELVEIKSKTKIDPNTVFPINLKWYGNIFVYGDIETGFSLLDEIPINCDNLCTDFFDALDTEDEVKGEFIHQGTGTIKLKKLWVYTN